MKRSYSDDMLDLAIKHAGHDILAEIAHEMPSDEEIKESIKYSDEFEKRIKKIIGMDFRRRRLSKVIRVVTKVAVIILVFLIVSTAVIFSSEALRIKVMNLFYQTGEKSTEIEITDNEEIENILEGLVVPSYIPEGYELEEKNRIGIIYNSIYKNSNNDMIKIEQINGSGNTTADTEKKPSYETEIMGHKIFVTECKGSEGKRKNLLVFNNDLFRFSISGNINISELLKIAESML